MNFKNFCTIAAACLLTALPTLAREDGTITSKGVSDPVYTQHFTGERLRLDLILAGNSETSYAFVEELHREASWTGSPNGLVDRSGYGQYFFEAFTSSGELIYSKSLSTLFEEWLTTEQAKHISMASGQSIWMPFPKETVHIIFYKRDRSTGLFDKMLEFDVDPADTHIIPGPDNNFKVRTLQYSGDPAHKVDLVFAGEAYTKRELPKLRRDAERMMEYLFSMEPYRTRRSDFNVYLVESVSQDSQIDIPNWNKWGSTIMDSSFDTFYTDRYLTIMNHKKIASVVSGAGFDTIFVIANESKYGGGGFYGSYAMGTSDHALSDVVFIHEFGHSFAGLGDEYYDSEVAYQDYYPAGVEPWEPNITTKVDFESKWKDMMGQNGVDLYEGAGYQAKGCWRSFEECRMLNNTAPGFCPVCQRAISRMIDYYVK